MHTCKGAAHLVHVQDALVQALLAHVAVAVGGHERCHLRHRADLPAALRHHHRAVLGLVDVHVQLVQLADACVADVDEHPHLQFHSRY